MWSLLMYGKTSYSASYRALLTSQPAVLISHREDMLRFAVSTAIATKSLEEPGPRIDNRYLSLAFGADVLVAATLDPTATLARWYVVVFEPKGPETRIDHG